jgi:hypothetical protein
MSMLKTPKLTNFLGPLFGFPGNTNFKGNVESQCNMVGALWVHTYGGQYEMFSCFPRENKGTNEYIYHGPHVDLLCRDVSVCLLDSTMSRLFCPHVSGCYFHHFHCDARDQATILLPTKNASMKQQE